MKSPLDKAKDNIKILYHSKINEVIPRKVPYMLNNYLETYIVDSYINFCEIHLDIVKEVINEIISSYSYLKFDSKESEQWFKNLNINSFEKDNRSQLWKFTEETLSLKPEFIFTYK